MFSPKLAFISPHLTGQLMSWRHKISPGPYNDISRNTSRQLYSAILTIISIAVTSGVCGLTIGLQHPIFAYEGDYQALQTKADIMSAAEIEAKEYERWITNTNYKYKNMAIQHPAKGIVHVKTIKWINGNPIKVNIVEINQKANSKINIKPELAGTTLNKRTSIKTMASRDNSIVAVNGGYFKPQTGVPLGTLMINRDIMTGPIYERVSMGINSDKTFSMDRVKIHIEVKNKHVTVKADNINQPRILSTYTLIYNRKWGEYAPSAPKYGVSLAVENGKIVNKSNGPIEIPAKGFVITGPYQNLAPLLREQKLQLDIKLPETFNKSEHIIGGGPYLVKDGNIFVDSQAQKFGAINGKNPRSAVGYTENNELIIVTVDGREQNSVGMTLWETARLMKDLGCVYAMNLDGGGSSVIYVKGRIENNPAQRGGIPLSNALVINENAIIAGHQS